MQVHPNEMRIAICDDDAIDRAQIERMTKVVLHDEGMDADITCYDSAASLLKAMRAGKMLNILLLDVMMEGMDGMDLAAELRAAHENASIVFISSNREMALRGYEVSAARYLAKPVDDAKLREALLYCCAICQKDRLLVLPAVNGQGRFAPSAIVYVETWERGVRLNLGTEKIEVKMPISQLISMLPEGQFAYCHRTLLVNLDYVRRVRYCELELKSGERLPISKYRLPEFKSAFMQHLTD